jgi:hypothetical protein
MMHVRGFSNEEHATRTAARTDGVGLTAAEGEAGESQAGECETGAGPM